MKNWQLYRAALTAIPRGRKPSDDMARALWRHHAVGGTVVAFDGGEETRVTAYGAARRSPRMPAAPDTAYRAASVSKLVTAMCAVKLHETGKIDLYADVTDALGMPLSPRNAARAPVSLYRLLTHTAGLRDGQAYTVGIARGEGLSSILRGDSYTDVGVGAFEYSNLGYGIAGAVMAIMTNTPFDDLMRETVFDPLSVRASYYPARVKTTLADAYRVLPPSRKANFDAASRIKIQPRSGIDPEKDYMLAHGNLCVTAPDLARIGMALCGAGFLSAASLALMRAPAASFGARAINLEYGVGTFILKDKSLCPRTLYGHQGLAYGAVHGLFFDPESGRGFSLLTSGASEARRGVLTDLNACLIQNILGDRR